MATIKNIVVKHVLYTAIGEVLLDQGQSFMFGFNFDDYLPDEVAQLKFNDVRSMDYTYDEEAEKILSQCLFQASIVADLSFCIGFSFEPYVKRYAKLLKIEDKHYEKEENNSFNA